MHLEIEDDPAHLTDDDLAILGQLAEAEGWTYEVVEQELLRKGLWEVLSARQDDDGVDTFADDGA